MIRVFRRIHERFGAEHTGGHGGLDILRRIGPGLLVTVGFIDLGCIIVAVCSLTMLVTSSYQLVER